MLHLLSVVLDRIQEPEQANSAQARIFGYLTRLVGNMKQDELSRFLRFVTGSSVVSEKRINIRFNKLEGIARRPITHTCSCLLELSTSYRNLNKSLLLFLQMKMRGLSCASMLFFKLYHLLAPFIFG